LNAEGTKRVTDLAFGPSEDDPSTVGAGDGPLLAAVADHDSGDVVVSVAGEMDLTTSPRFQRDVLALLALPIDRVIIDWGSSPSSTALVSAH
jgi:hypothetical protein